MTARTAAFALALALGVPTIAAAQDAAADAREELKRGFALRHDGKFEEALPHLVASYRLAPGTKVLLNLADCEEHLEHLVDAEQHWLQARDLAHGEGNAPAEQEASDRLKLLEPRIPRLVVVLAPGTPATTHVEKDGQEMAGSSLGASLACDPGSHHIEVRAEGHDVARTEVMLREGEARRVEVAPGASIEGAPSPEPAPTPPVTLPAPTSAVTSPPPVEALKPAPTTETASGVAWPYAVAIGLGAAGVAGIVFGAVEGLAAQRQHDEAVAACGPSCSASPSAQSLQSDARTDATLANIGLIGGGVLVLASASFFIVPSLGHQGAPSTGTAARQVRSVAVAPLVGRVVRGAAVEVAW